MTLRLHLIIYCPYKFQNEELLADVLFSTYSLMGRDEKGTSEWVVTQGTESPITVNLKQIKSHLKEVFSISEESMDQITKEITQRQVFQYFIETNQH